MNAHRRKQLQKLIEKADSLYAEIDEITQEEQEAFDNLSDNLQATERGQNIESAVNALDEALSHLRAAVDEMEQAINF